MNTNRNIEIFSAGCPICRILSWQIQEAACSSCDIEVLDLQDQTIAARALSLGIRSIPAVVIDGVLADCCSGRGPDLDVLRAAGLGAG